MITVCLVGMMCYDAPDDGMDDETICSTGNCDPPYHIVALEGRQYVSTIFRLERRAIFSRKGADMLH